MLSSAAPKHHWQYFKAGFYCHIAVKVVSQYAYHRPVYDPDLSLMKETSHLGLEEVYNGPVCNR
jgi:hypothetical protein|tara:strand:- start:1206 stop:1397 length:192 start_codon:yes stop_codon:yes gene_type:complete